MYMIHIQMNSCLHRVIHRYLSSSFCRTSRTKRREGWHWATGAHRRPWINRFKRLVQPTNVGKKKKSQTTQNVNSSGTRYAVSSWRFVLIPCGSVSVLKMEKKKEKNGQLIIRFKIYKPACRRIRQQNHEVFGLPPSTNCAVMQSICRCFAVCKTWKNKCTQNMETFFPLQTSRRGFPNSVLD